MRQLLSLLILVTSITAWANIEKCLSTGTLSDIKPCAQKWIKPLNSQSCFSTTDKIKSQLMKQNFREYCFYYVSDFKNITDCTKEAQKFTTAQLHDDALMTCAQDFQSELTQKSCTALSEKLLYVDKKNYLLRQCEKL